MGTQLGLKKLASLGRGSVRLGLDRMERALADLGHPPWELRALLVAGTNGKGSTCARAASAVRAAGYRVGLHTIRDGRRPRRNPRRVASPDAAWDAQGPSLTGREGALGD